MRLWIGEDLPIEDVPIVIAIGILMVSPDMKDCVLNSSNLRTLNKNTIVVLESILPTNTIINVSSLDF